MKIPFPLPVAACLLLLVVPTRAEETGGPPQPSARKIVRTVSPPMVANAPGTPAPGDESKLTRFDLDFPGGTPAELAAAISKAMGKHLNLVVPPEKAGKEIMPLKVEGVTVPELFLAISRASSHSVEVKIGPSANVYRDIMIQFFTDGTPSDESVWAFSENTPHRNELVANTLPPVPVVCRYFQLASYLENYSIEDITTAIQTGWKMAKVEPMPQLSFHKETSLLIAVGTQASVSQIPDVLNALRLDRGPAIEKIERLREEGLEIEAKKAEGWQAKSQEIQKKISEIAARQRASEEIDNGGRRQIRPAPVTN